MRERSFVQRNKRVQLWELTDVVALRERDDTRRSRHKRHIPTAIAADVPASQWHAFEKAGWVFQERSAGELPTGVPQAKVFVKPGGRVVLGTNQLTIQLPDDPSEEQTNRLLQPYGCRGVERLKFAPGLFQVAMTEAGPGGRFGCGQPDRGGRPGKVRRTGPDRGHQSSLSLREYGQPVACRDDRPAGRCATPWGVTLGSAAPGRAWGGAESVTAHAFIPPLPPGEVGVRDTPRLARTFSAAASIC